ncbi:unnamed protein product [Pleuronectes platessa]|uniref:Uncharacterized protein n=1 Tax=Pleuronectes platessa TaxID=8262 RepID=A0A9N7Y3N1_PLEPL|nr:unnamed protein product [Pleuronectes platessa]
MRRAAGDEQGRGIDEEEQYGERDRDGGRQEAQQESYNTRGPAPGSSGKANNEEGVSQDRPSSLPPAKLPHSLPSSGTWERMASHVERHRERKRESAEESPGRQTGQQAAQSNVIQQEQSAALKATTAPCHCYELTEALRNANLKPVSHREVYGGMPTVTQASNLETC